MYINDLPNEILYLILEQVEIANWNDRKQVSFLGDLEPCAFCHHFQMKCKHLHLDEIEGIKDLVLVCRHWRAMIRDMFTPHFRIYSIND
jgi:hypothetical protein